MVCCTEETIGDTEIRTEKTAHLAQDWLRGYFSMLWRASDMTELKIQDHTRNRYAKRFVGILNERRGGSPSSVNKQRVCPKEPV